MKTFPKDIQFKFPWRPYQKRVLDELEGHLDDRHLNIVAAPGSGKTVLGLEVMLRIDQPTLILAPSIAIKNQWIQRFTELFLQVKTKPEWISKNIKNPKRITVSTYQSLHSALRDNTEESKKQLVSALKSQGITCLIVDEAHHLRREWWKSLVMVKESLKDPHVVSLTATPPYDVDPQEWVRYQQLTGPVDAEISVPELVKANNLCPHQDYIYFNDLQEKELHQIQDFRKGVEDFLAELSKNQEFTEAVLAHPYFQDSDKHIRDILKNPAGCSAMLIYLHHLGERIPSHIFSVLGTSRWSIPAFNDEWAEELFSFLLAKDEYFKTQHKELQKHLRRDFSELGALEGRKVRFKNNSLVRKIMRRSLNKLQSITDITHWEHQSMKDQLRMVILSDYIRKEALPQHKDDRDIINILGVVPIFEKIRRTHQHIKRIGVLTGSLVIIPTASLPLLKASAKELQIPLSHIRSKALVHDEDYLKVSLKGTSNQQIVQLITRVFSKGGINILVGTKSLLGEGWDAPSINSLILASFVGSFMLSNQMRGRAIRKDPAVPNKSSNIWHLATVETLSFDAGHDYKLLTRRFKAFVGVSFADRSIENGIRRMNIGKAPYTSNGLKALNKRMMDASRAREGMVQQWEEILQTGKINQIIPKVKTPSRRLPRKFVFKNTIHSVFYSGMWVGVIKLFELLAKGNNMSSLHYKSLLVILFFGFLVSLPGLLKSVYLLVRHGSVSNSMKLIARALLETLIHMKTIKTDPSEFQIKTERSLDGQMSCYLERGTSFEKSLFFDAFQELLNPIENPRYVLCRKSRFKWIQQQDFHAVPSVIGTHKKWASVFAKKWNQYVGRNYLIYTRSIIGRRMLLKARQKALSSSFLKKSERVSVWK